MEIISNIALISINETLFVQLISFLLFLFVMNRLMFKPLQTVMAERTGRVDKAQKDILETKKTIENLNADLAKQEVTARKEAAKLMRELAEQGKLDAVEILSSVRNEIVTLKEKTLEDINSKISEARTSLDKESSILADQIMEKILGRELGAAPPPPKKKPEPKKPVSISELLAKKFDWKQSEPEKVTVKKAEVPDAPPFFEGDDEESVRELLFKKFDLTEPDTKKTTTPKKPAKVPAAKKKTTVAPKKKKVSAKKKNSGKKISAKKKK